MPLCVSSVLLFFVDRCQRTTCNADVPLALIREICRSRDKFPIPGRSYMNKCNSLSPPQHTRANPSLVMRGPHVRRPRLCCPAASSECTTVTEVRARREILKSSGRWFNYLRRGHVAGKCKSRSLCRHCNKRHNTSICEGRGTQNATPATTQAPVTPTLNPDAPPFESTSTTLCASEEKSVLLQTACARVYSSSNAQPVIELRVLFDSGSQRSYTSQNKPGDS